MYVRNPQELGQFVKGKRHALGMTQDQLAQCAGVARATVSRLESGRENAALTVVFAVVHALDLSLKIEKPKYSEGQVDLDLLLEKYRRKGSGA